MTTEVLQASLEGIDRMIKAREAQLRAMKVWLTNPLKAHTTYANIISFYACGIRTMYEIKRLKQIKTDLNNLTTMSETKERPKKKINAYICSELHATVTEDVHQGTTPMFIECPKCKSNHKMNAARSQMYLVNQSLPPSHEWYKPIAEQMPAIQAEYGSAFKLVLEHLNQGGLLLREKKTLNLWQPGR
jgi:hypothetical protein